MTARCTRGTSDASGSEFDDRVVVVRVTVAVVVRVVVVVCSDVAVVVCVVFVVRVVVERLWVVDVAADGRLLEPPQPPTAAASASTPTHHAAGRRAAISTLSTAGSVATPSASVKRSARAALADVATS
jgi:hypothetical protein